MTETITYKVVNHIDADQLKKDLTFSTADLGTAMVEQASLFVHYGVLAGKCKRQVDDLKLLLENAEAKVYRLLRDKAVSTGEKVTEAQLEKQVSAHSQIGAFKRALNEAKQIEAVAGIAVEAFRHRKDMLIQQGAASREEMKGDLYMAARQAAHQASEDQRHDVVQRLQQMKQGN